MSITSSVSAGRRSQQRGGVARHILGMSIPGIKSTSRGASLEKTVMEEIPEQLRTPKVPQVRSKILLYKIARQLCCFYLQLGNFIYLPKSQ